MKDVTKSVFPEGVITCLVELFRMAQHTKRNNCAEAKKSQSHTGSTLQWSSQAQIYWLSVSQGEHLLLEHRGLHYNCANASITFLF